MNPKTLINILIILFSIAAVKATAIDAHYTTAANRIKNDTIIRVNGKTTILTIYNGEKVVEVIRMRNGKKSGLHEKFNGNGSLKTSKTYKNGHLNGKYIVYNSRGQITEDKTYNYDKKKGHSSLQGKYKKYYNTRLVLEANYKDNLLHGKAIEYANNNLKSIKHYKKGKLSGNVKKYNYANGLLTTDENYRIIKKENIDKSVLYGKCTYYSSNGSIANTGDYKNGDKEGLWKTYFHNTPNIKSEISYKEGLKNGSYKNYYSNGNIKSEGEIFEELLTNKRKNSKYNGEIKEYYENGVIAKISHYSMGYKTGEWQTYYNNSNIKSTGNYSHDLLTGTWLHYGLAGDTSNTTSYKIITKNNKEVSVKHGTEIRWKNGIKVFEQTYNNGKKDGKGISYYGNGKVSNLMNFTDGHLTGDYIDYYRNGALKSYRTYRIDTNIRNQIKSIIIGEQYRYDKDGSLTFKEYRQNNEKISYNIYYYKGKIAKIQYTIGLTLNYFPDGNLMSIIFNDQRSQPIFAQYYYRNGQTRIISFQNEKKKVINQILYTSSGDLMTTTNYAYQNPDSLKPSPATIIAYKNAVGLHYINNSFYTDSIRNGSYKLFYANGNPMCSMQLKDEMLDGPFILFDAINGDTLKYLNLKDGVQYGAYLEKFAGKTTIQKGEFYDNGQKKSSEQYSKSGLATLKETFDRDGKRIEYFTYHSNGKIKNYTNYATNANRSYDIEGNILNEVITIGRLSIRNTYYPLTKQIRSKKIYKDNQKDSLWTTYYKTGVLKTSLYYSQNKKNGKYLYYNKEGNIKTNGNYKNDLADGKWITIRNGIADTIYYKKGRAIVKQILKQCECIDTTMYKLGFAPSLDMLIDYYSLTNSFPAYIQALDSNAYKSIFYSGLYTGNGSYSLTMLMFKKLSFELPADKQLRITINPCHTKGYISKVRASAYIDPSSPHKRLVINPDRISVEFIKGPLQSDDINNTYFTASFNMESMRFFNDEKPRMYMDKDIDPCFTKAKIKNYLHLKVNEASLKIFETPYNAYQKLNNKELDNFFGIQIEDADITFNYYKAGTKYILKAKSKSMLAGGNFAAGRIILECIKTGVDNFELTTEQGVLKFTSQNLKIEWLKKGFTHLNLFYSEELNSLVIDFYAK